MACAVINAQETPDIFITGDAVEQGWTYSNPEETRLVPQPDGLYVWKGTLKKDGRFRFLTGKGWYPTYTTAESSHLTVNEGEYAIRYDAEKRSGEPSFRVGTGGEYTLSLDLKAMTMTLKLDKKTDNPEQPRIYIVGSGCPAGWSTGAAIELQRLDNGHYTWTGDLTKENEGRFRFITSRNWYPTYTTGRPEHTPVKEGEYSVAYYETAPKGEPSFKVEVAGNYTVDLDIEAMIMKLTLHSAVEDKKMFIIGNATSGLDSDAEDAMQPIEMHLIGESLFEWTGNLYAETATGAGTVLRFSPDPTQTLNYTCRTDLDGNEDITAGDTFDLFEKNADDGTFDNWFHPLQQGRYTITVDTRLMTMTVQRNKTELYIVGGAVSGGNTPWAFNEKYLARMTETETPLVFEWTGKLYATTDNGSPARFKFLTSNSAWEGFVSASDEHVTIAKDMNYPLADSNTPGSGDFQFMVPSDGIYRLLADTRSLTLSVSDGTDGLPEAADSGKFRTLLCGRTLTIEADDTADVAIFDTTGRCVVSQRLTEGTISLPGAGLYIVRINESITKIAVK